MKFKNKFKKFCKLIEREGEPTFSEKLAMAALAGEMLEDIQKPGFEVPKGCYELIPKEGQAPVMMVVLGSLLKAFACVE